MGFIFRGHTLRVFLSETFLHVAALLCEVVLAVVVVEFYLNEVRSHPHIAMLARWLHEQLNTYRKTRDEFADSWGRSKFNDEKTRYRNNDCTLMCAAAEQTAASAALNRRKEGIDKALLELHESLADLAKFVGRFSDPAILKSVLDTISEEKAFRAYSSDSAEDTDNPELLKRFLDLDLAFDSLEQALQDARGGGAARTA